MTRTLDTLEFVGGALCLDFANTINSRIDPEHDYLVQYSDLLGWADKAGILSPAQINRLQKRAKRNPDKAENASQQARDLRELLYRLFSRTTKNFQPNKKDIEAFTSAYGESVSRAHLIKTEGHYTPTWKVDETFHAVLWPILHSAGELLQSEQLAHVKECSGCGWLFLDTSKNQSRRWCSMNTCGARDKMRRYHKRQRAR